MKKMNSVRFLLTAILLCAVFIHFILHRLLPGTSGNMADSPLSSGLSPESAIEVVSGSDGNYIK